MVGGALFRYNQIPCLLGGWPTDWKIIVLQRFSHRSESSEPNVRVPTLRVWHREEKPPEHLALKASSSWVQELHRQGETDSTLGGTQHKAVTPQEPGLDLLADLGGSPGKVEVSCGSLWGQGHWRQRPHGILIGMSSHGGCNFGTETWPHPTACRLQCWNTSGQTTSRAGDTALPINRQAA